MKTIITAPSGQEDKMKIEYLAHTWREAEIDGSLKESFDAMSQEQQDLFACGEIVTIMWMDDATMIRKPRHEPPMQYQPMTAAEERLGEED